jgi:hypothetical protein
VQAIAPLGLAETIADKLRRFDTSTLLNRHLADRADTAAIGFGPVAEIKSWHGKASHMPARRAATRAAHMLLAFLATPAAREQFLASGVE